MICGLLIDAMEEERKAIRQHLSKLTAYHTDEKLEIREVSISKALEPAIEAFELLDLAIVDVTLPGALDGAKEIRKKYSQTEIMVIADASVSPMLYMHPSIRASALLLRPAAQGWGRAIGDFFEQILTRTIEENQKDVLLVENREGTYRIPYAQIYYLEAREKRVFVRTKTQEYAVSTTLDALEKELPEQFARCHRSFIVNRKDIETVKLSESTLELRDGLSVPVSRSYKSEFKKQGRKGAVNGDTGL
ncbi:MAG: LytTR family DNA-binding domain-containing protein [Eubacteriales bacterium]|nr:LytTR family DNA-binding domain-containing protein [Eubacteriales bacterium]